MYDELLATNKQFGKEGVQWNLWMGGRNVTTHLHYDSLVNCYIQCFGTKRFNVLPPSSFKAVYLYSRHHVHNLQSQVSAAILCC